MSDRRDDRVGAVERAAAHARRFLENTDAMPAGAPLSVEELRSRLERPLADSGVEAATVIDELARDIGGGIAGNAGGRYYGWVVGGSLPAALAADWLVSTWDQNAAMFAVAPGVSVVEEIAGSWVKEILGLPAEAAFAFVTGCQMAHFTSLAAARHRVLARHGWDVEASGLFGAPPIQVLTGSEHHGTVTRALRMLGLGENSIVSLPVDDNGQLRAETLRAALDERGAGPTLVALQAGDVNAGVFDPFDELIPLARERGAWVHVDGAFGLWVAADPQRRHLVRGIEAADSWATDGHKWLNVPYDCGIAIVNDPEALSGSLSHRTACYLDYDETARDPLDWNPEWSRRARGVATYAAIRELGRAGVADLVDRTCRHAAAIVSGVGALDGAEIVAEPVINQGLVSFGNAEFTDAVIAEVARSGEAFFSGTTWRGRRAMRVSVSSWRTDDDDVRRTIAAVATALEAVTARG